MGADVFISYARTDRGFAATIAEALRASSMAASDVCATTTALFTCHGGDGSLSPETASVLFFEMGQGTSQLLPVRLAPKDVAFFLPEGDEAPDDTGCQALRGTAGLFYCAGVDPLYQSTFCHARSEIPTSA